LQKNHCEKFVARKPFAKKLLQKIIAIKPLQNNLLPERRAMI
jgi:hypothetical protein